MDVCYRVSNEYGMMDNRDWGGIFKKETRSRIFIFQEFRKGKSTGVAALSQLHAWWHLLGIHLLLLLLI